MLDVLSRSRSAYLPVANPNQSFAAAGNPTEFPLEVLQRQVLKLEGGATARVNMLSSR